jgi:hypothetical protein
METAIKASGIERRRFRRYPMQLSLRVTRYGRQGSSWDAITKNISRGGVLFALKEPMELGTPIEFFVDFPEKLSEDAKVRMRGQGRVVRSIREVSRDPKDPGMYIVAATMDRCEIHRQQ